MSFEDITDEYVDFGSIDFDQLDDSELIVTDDDDGLSIPLIRSVHEQSKIQVESKELVQPETIPVQPVQYKNKMEHARIIFEREKQKGPVVRKNIIKMFMEEANCTAAGASTYYQTINSKG